MMSVRLTHWVWIKVYSHPEVFLEHMPSLAFVRVVQFTATQVKSESVNLLYVNNIYVNNTCPSTLVYV